MDWNSRRITAILEMALLEDRATSDATTAVCIDPHLQGVATIRARQDCVIAGLGLVERIFEVFGHLSGNHAVLANISISPEVFDGVRLHNGQTVAVVRHNARALLSCERVTLNILQRLSGIATMTRHFVDKVSGTKAHILDTRKTVPGLRQLDKYAVSCGGGVNHRLDLSDGILIKNNHISLAGGIVPALESALRNRRGNLPIEIEVRNEGELEQALEAGAEAILLDNMTPEQCRRAVGQIRQHTRRIFVEASGGIVLDNVREYAETGVDFISIGALTHSPKAANLNMNISPA